LLAGAARELAWGLPAVAREVSRWQKLTREIPDSPIRQDALNALQRKRGQTDGAAMFSILPSTRSPSLLRLLVAYQIIWDFLDSVHERAPDRRNGNQLHLALLDALDPRRPISDYFRHHPWRDDGGYLLALVTTCRDNCVRLPSYEYVRPFALCEAMRAHVLPINHNRDPRSRDAALEKWAAREFPNGHEAHWFELTGAASAGLTIFALLALACEPRCNETDITRLRSVYFPWISAVATMLDSYVDQVEDTASDDHIYISHYQTPEIATQHICLLIRRSMRRSRTLRDGHKHILIVSCMVAMYLSKDSARSPAMRDTTRLIADAGGSLTSILLPILRLWRILYAQRST
jgi:tetraprenyl-beta-curcumene synthase